MHKCKTFQSFFSGSVSCRIHIQNTCDCISWYKLHMSIMHMEKMMYEYDKGDMNSGLLHIAKHLSWSMNIDCSVKKIAMSISYVVCFRHFYWKMHHCTEAMVIFLYFSAGAHLRNVFVLHWSCFSVSRKPVL